MVGGVGRRMCVGVLTIIAPGAVGGGEHVAVVALIVEGNVFSGDNVVLGAGVDSGGEVAAWDFSGDNVVLGGGEVLGSGGGEIVGAIGAATSAVGTMFEYSSRCTSFCTCVGSGGGNCCCNCLLSVGQWFGGWVGVVGVGGHAKGESSMELELDLGLLVMHCCIFTASSMHRDMRFHVLRLWAASHTCA